MTTISKFKNSYSLASRIAESQRIMAKYPDRIPIICEKNPACKDAPEIDKIKYLVQRDLTIGQFIYVIRKRIKIGPEKGLFLFVNQKIPSSTQQISDTYNYERDSDGFLYFSYSIENTFGLNHTYRNM